MKFVCTILATLIVCAVHAQSYDPQKISSKATKLYTQALQLASDDNLQESIHMLQQAIQIDTRYEDAYLSLAGMYGELQNYDSAIINYEKARDIDSIYFKDYNLPYSIDLAGRGFFEKALAAVTSFKTTPNLSESSIKAASYRE